VAQQLREATPYGRHPKHLILDNDSKYGPAFTRVAQAIGIDLVRTAYRAPKENAICERFLGSVRRECLDHLLVLGEAQLRRSLRGYVNYFNTARPHQGVRQRVPVPPPKPVSSTGPVRAIPVLGGLHHNYVRAA
jgi:transposase InsO family protein